jgi:hypothetical protein
VHFYFRGRRLCAVRSGNWKLHLWTVKQGKRGKYRRPVVCNPPQLYSLDMDPGETQNVAGGNEAVVARLKQLADDFEASMVRGKLPPPQWRSVLPRVRGGKRQG